MSEQRRMRSQLKQGLHQYLMQMYTSYTESMGQDEAMKLILEVIEEQYKYFSPATIRSTSVKDVLTARIDELTDKMEATKDLDTQAYLAEKVDALHAALDALEIKIS